MMTTTTTTTTTNITNTTNTNKEDEHVIMVVRAVVDAMVDAAVAVDEEDCGHATFADLCAPYITLEEARKEKAEEARNAERRAKWEDRIESAQHRAFKRVRAAAAAEEEEERAVALRARLGNPSAMWFAPALERKVTLLDAPGADGGGVPGRHARARCLNFI